MLSTLVVSFLLASSSVFAAHLHPHGKRADLSVVPVTATATEVALVSSTGAGLKLLTTQAAAVQSTGVAGLDITAILQSIAGTDAAALASASAYAASYVAAGGDLASLLGGTATALVATAAPVASSASELVASALNYPDSAVASGSASSSVNAAGLVLSSASASASASASSSSLTGSAHQSLSGGGFLVVALGAAVVSLGLL